ncbi:nucleotidyltransferase domain-containing protein [Pseudalkalibacillus caeni]|uniref:Renal dipeptidase n=1 Tax=Exobacillus caeni TaxID=2574798 RepID=A0A5R9F254_9BACL|nr:nucleotidyltransferase family protein [Pseudalkalibacillus caeni]TLS35558.1 Renal dipeptidase [Pseudalkalibacillus caeni]
MLNNASLNVSAIPKELKLILGILGKSQTVKKDMFIDIDWDKFCKLALHHRVYPLLYTKLTKSDIEDIPCPVLQTLEIAFKKNTLHMLHLTSQMEQLSKLCSENNIPCIILKGPVLAFELYGNLSLRTCGDLDVLVPIHKLEKVDQLLTEQGFKMDDYIETVLADWKWRHHHVTYFHPVLKTKLEIHWRLNPGPGKEPSFEELWKRKRKFQLNSQTVYYLGIEDLLLFLVSHGARHGWSRLRWLMDIHYITEQEVNSNKLLTLSKDHHNSHLLGQALNLSSQLLDTRVNKDLDYIVSKRKSERLAQEAIYYLERMVNLHNNPVPNDVALYHSRHLFSLMSFNQKVIYLLSLLHPFPEDAQTLPLPKKFHFLYFPLRPILWLWRKTRKFALP